ncbi:STAS domain-containing protein [Brevundimonas sp.]|uniref:STAS domain-containing protein n=1 Tax=Brevundimonas sp. TaxID=1871086 RepID=UPI002897C443|nr:STAS domain-containing protein [Brevundimonas sp.]
MADVLVLPEILDLKAAAPLKAELVARRGQDLVLDASGVQRLGGLCLQVLLSAARTWAADGVNLRLGSVSQPLGEQWAAFGAPDLINEGAQA